MALFLVKSLEEAALRLIYSLISSSLSRALLHLPGSWAGVNYLLASAKENSLGAKDELVGVVSDLRKYLDLVGVHSHFRIKLLIEYIKQAARKDKLTPELCSFLDCILDFHNNCFLINHLGIAMTLNSWLFLLDAALYLPS